MRTSQKYDSKCSQQEKAQRFGWWNWDDWSKIHDVFLFFLVFFFLFLLFFYDLSIFQSCTFNTTSIWATEPLKHLAFQSCLCDVNSCWIVFLCVIFRLYAQVDFCQLQVNTLRRYKRHYKLQTRPGLNKSQLVEVWT